MNVVIREKSNKCPVINICDQTGKKLSFAHPPRRIISLVPSLTEMFCDIGLGQLLIGRTRFCIHPKPYITSIPKIGGTKTPSIEEIIRLQPDLIIANKEENRMEDINLLSQYPVYVSDISTMDDVITILKDLSLLYPESKALQLGSEIKHAVPERKNIKFKTVYLIWKDPWMTVGNDSFIHHMMEAFGFENVFSHKTRYPVITIKEIYTLKPEIIMLSSEPYPFKQKHFEELENQIPDSKIILVNGEMFSWYGSRILKASAYLEALYKTF